MYNFLLAATALVGLVSAAPTTLKAPSAVLPRQGGDFYTQYNGDGSEAAGWPSQAAWVSDLDTMFAANKAVMMASCVDGVPNNSEDETAAVKTAVQSQAAAAGLDERFVFAVIMQESHGCVRANTTDNGVRNPGLMQSHDGTATCNDLGVVTNPCPPEQIERMVKDGAARTAAGDGLQQTLAQAGGTGSQAVYKAARIYNSGSIDPSGDLGAGGSTHCYSSDIANRLTGWVGAPHTCTLDG